MYIFVDVEAFSEAVYLVPSVASGDDDVLVHLVVREHVHGLHACWSTLPLPVFVKWLEEKQLMRSDLAGLQKMM